MAEINTIIIYDFETLKDIINNLTDNVYQFGYDNPRYLSTCDKILCRLDDIKKEIQGKETEDNKVAGCCKNSDALEMYTDPITDQLHDKECIQKEIKYLKENFEPKDKGDRVKQLEKVIEGAD